ARHPNGYAGPRTVRPGSGEVRADVCVGRVHVHPGRHEIADADDADELAVLDHRDVPELALVHDLSRLTGEVVRREGDRVWCHVGLHTVLVGVATVGDGAE